MDWDVVNGCQRMSTDVNGSWVTRFGLQSLQLEETPILPVSIRVRVRIPDFVHFVLLVWGLDSDTSFVPSIQACQGENNANAWILQFRESCPDWKQLPVVEGPSPTAFHTATGWMPKPSLKPT